MKTLGLCIALFFGLGASAQCVNTNGNMETYTSQPVQGNVWINNSLTNWNVSHGSPSIGLTPTTHIWMWSWNKKGEGMFTNYAFTSGTTYEISYRLWRDAVSDPTSIFRVALTTGLLGSGSTSIPSPATNQSLNTQTWAGAAGNWVTITQTITAGANYNQLWFHPYLATSATNVGQAACRIDDICIKVIPKDPCDFKPQLSVKKNDCTITAINTTSIPTGFTILETYWNFGDGTTGTGSILDHFYTTEGTYKLCMTVWMINKDGECCKKIICKEIEAPTCNPCELIEKAEIITTGSNPFNFSIAGLPNGLYSVLGYQWNFGDGTVGTGNPINHSYYKPEIYKVCVTIYYYDPNEKRCCSVELCIDVTVKEGVENVDKMKLIKNNNFINGVNYEEDQKARQISAANQLILSPNPTNGEFEIRLKDNGVINAITVYNQIGTTVYKVENINTNALYKMNLSSLKKGTYIVIINEMDDSNRSFSKLIIK